MGQRAKKSSADSNTSGRIESEETTRLRSCKLVCSKPEEREQSAQHRHTG